MTDRRVRVYSVSIYVFVPVLYILSVSYPHTGLTHSLSMRMTFLFPISLLLLFSGFVGASLYPTCPIAKTVYRGGTWNNISWIDSEESPPLYQMGKMSIHLWVDDTVSVWATFDGATLYTLGTPNPQFV